MSGTAFSVVSDPRLRAELLAKVSDSVAEVEAEIRTQCDSRVDLVRKVASHTLEAGGKRLRPAFVALAAKACNPDADEDRLRRFGACMEMVHMATLVHDDVIDNSATRRGRATASSVFGNTAAILSGDVLLAKAMVILAQDGDLNVIETVSHTVIEMAEGEVRELEVRGDFDLDAESHLQVIRMKTAAFIECCCRIGTLAAGGSAKQLSALARYGDAVGMAFQIADDVLDYRGERQLTGKPLATDFREGQATLPLIALRSKLSEAELQIARRRFGGTVNEDEIRMICDWMETRGAFTEAFAKAQDYVANAHEALAELPDSLAKDMLGAIADYVISRQS